jgi:hypothetical protein
LNKIGAFSINIGSRSAIESINFLKTLLRDKKNMVLYYPQGVFQSVYDQSIHFESGISKILKGFTSDDIQVLFYAAMLDYFAEKKPMLTFTIGEYKLENGISLSELESAYNQFYKGCIKNQIDSV